VATESLPKYPVFFPEIKAARACIA
jgi:hypothetical protein